jgi:hypothetical protein
MNKMPDRTKEDQLNQLIELTRRGEAWSFKAQEIATLYLQDIKEVMDIAERVLRKTDAKKQL